MKMSDTIEVRDPRFDSVVGKSVAAEKLAGGFLFTEGPLWHARDRYLLFSDMPGDHMRKWTAGEGISTFRKPCAQSNGLTWDRQGRLVVCQHATSTLTRTEPDGASVVLASHHQGKELNSPNDERHLFVNDTERKHIRRFDVAADGSLANGRVWAETTGPGKGAPDGMKIDSAGNIYCCGPGGIHVFAPDAACLGVIRLPETAANFCFGDDDRRSLYVTASTSLYRVRVATPGTAQWQC
jgi:sugar lactone lactonase YvrE